MAEQQTLRQKMAAKPGEKTIIHWGITSAIDPSVAGPIQSGGLPGGEPNRPFGPCSVKVACDDRRRLEQGFAMTGITFLVTCPECVKHPLFAKHYQVDDVKCETYEDIPLLHRQAIEAAERAAGLGTPET